MVAQRYFDFFHEDDLLGCIGAFDDGSVFIEFETMTDDGVYTQYVG